jgi:hypothetical protein
MTQRLDETFEKVVQESRADPNVLGLIVGSAKNVRPEVYKYL